MGRTAFIACTVVALGADVADVAGAQQPVAVIDLPAATVRTRETFGGIIGVREVTGGFVLVNDGGRRMIKRYDPTLTTSALVADSTRGAPNSYGPIRTRLMPYFGDSSLFADFESQTVLVLDGNGAVAKALAIPKAEDFRPILTSSSAADPKGRLLYEVWRPTSAMIRGPSQLPVDSAAIVRADLDGRRVDTLARVKVYDGGGYVEDNSVPDRPKMTNTLNPLPVFDVWAMLSDGTIALVRGHDYHVDWVHPDGTTSSSPKMAFDWKRVTDDEKRQLIDSARKANDSVAARFAAGAKRATGNQASPRDGGISGDAPPPSQPQLIIEYLPLDRISDYWPAIRPGAATPDLDGNLWILPTTSAQSRHGELVYDVVNPEAGLFKRVRIPEGRSLVGFGPGGTVYLAVGNRTTGFYLEKTRLPGVASK